MQTYKQKCVEAYQLLVQGNCGLHLRQVMLTRQNVGKDNITYNLDERNMKSVLKLLVCNEPGNFKLLGITGTLHLK